MTWESQHHNGQIDQESLLIHKKIQVYLACALGVLLYGNEAWNTHWLNAIHMSMISVLTSIYLEKLCAKQRHFAMCQNTEHLLHT